jgi:exopolyphosphatase / guanosine-5'-triphosphate,3'-diphosphate pyrophosphatase
MSEAPLTPVSRDAAAAEPERRVVAAIDIGSSAIRLDIGEIGDQGDVHLLESLRHGVRLGKDVFAKGRIQQETLRRCVSILKNYGQMLKEYGITRADQVRAVATSFAREASNRDMFVDRVSTATGIQVRILEESEEARLTYLAVRDILEENGILDDGNVAVLELGGGQTTLLFLRGGRVTVAQAFRTGALRTHELVAAGGGANAQAKGILKVYATELSDQIRQAIPRKKVSVLVVMGAGAQFGTEHAASVTPTKDSRLVKVDSARIMDLAEHLAGQSEESLVQTYQMTYQEAETVAPAMMSMAQAAKALKVKEILLVDATLRDGLLREMAMRDYRSEGFEDQVIDSALTMAGRFATDMQHVRNVEAASVALFDELKEEYHLGGHERLLLRCASILHDIGSYVHTRAHHKHSMYLIRNSDLFGLTRHDMLLVGTVSRYHRKALPSPSHPEFASLTLEDRMTVSKLAAILRVADSLDRTHRDAPRPLEFRREGERFVILVRDMEDLTVERLVLRTKGTLFAEVFGLIPELRELRTDSAGGVIP